MLRQWGIVVGELAVRSRVTLRLDEHGASPRLREPLTIRIGNSSEPSGRTITSC